MKGKWYLAFTWHNDFEPRGGITEHVKILLNATTEEEAITEAKALAEFGENVETSYGHMPVLEHYSVIYEAPIQ